MIKEKIFLVLSVLFLNAGAFSQNEGKWPGGLQARETAIKSGMNTTYEYQNPVIPGFYPDPSICRNGDDYYLVTSSFRYYPGVPIFHSRDLVHWEQIGHCLTRPNQFLQKDDNSYSIWAPTIRCHKGRFYMATHNRTTKQNFFVYTDNPAGEWSDPIVVDSGQIDPDIFFDPSGRVYWLVSSNWLMEIDLKTGKVIGQKKQIWKGDGRPHDEGPHLYFRDGWYYIMQAEGGLTRHVETIARSRDIWGPYENCPHNPILNHNNLAISVIQGTGHADMVEAHDGSWWMVFLGIRVTSGQDCMITNLGRETFLSPVRWTKDGWPIVNETGTVTSTMKSQLIAWNPLPIEPVRDDFDANKLAFKWNYDRYPVKENYSLTERPGYLRMRDSVLTGAKSGAHTFVGRRQQHTDFSAATCIDFNPQQDNEEAGLTVFQTGTFHYDVAIKRVDGVRSVIVRRTIGTLSAIVASEALKDGPVVLEVHGSKDVYTLGYYQGTQKFKPLATGESRLLSTWIADICVGGYLAMYTTGNGKSSKTPADFDWFDYKPVKEQGK